MSSIKKSTNIKSEVVQEDKKPPVIQEPVSKTENQEITPELEKKLYIEGEEHLEENSQNQSNEVVTEIKEENTKKQIITRPREAYLNEKISKMNYNKNIMSNIKKELNDQMKTIVSEDNILITEIPKDLNRYIKSHQKTESSKFKISDTDYTSKQKFKQLKNLIDEQNILKKNLEKIIQNEKLLTDEDFNNIIKPSSSYDNNNANIIFDKNMKEQKLKSIQQKKNNIMERIKNIDAEIAIIMSDIEPNNNMSNLQKKKLYLANIEKDITITPNAKKYMKETKERYQQMLNHLNNIEKLEQKEKKQIEEIAKKDKTKYEKKLKEVREKELELEKHFSKLNGEIVDKYKPFFNKGLKKRGKDYRYSQMYSDYLKNEEKKFNVGIEERMKIFELNKIEQINEFTKKIDEKLKENEYEREQKKMELSENWKKNKENLPKSKYDTLNMEDNNKKEEEEKKEKTQARNLVKINYSEMIRNKLVPEIDENLKKQREKKILSMENPKPVKYTMKNQKKNRILLKKRDDSKPPKFKWALKLREQSVDKLREVNENLIHKPKKINFAPITKTISSIPDVKPDYLQEIINERKEKNKAKTVSRNEIDEDELNTEEKEKKWDKDINSNNNRTLAEKINNVKEKANVLEKEAKMKEKLLKINEIDENNPVLGKKVSSLLLDSITAKLSILKKMNES